MSRRKNHAQPETVSPAARVDDTLVRNVRVRDNILGLLGEQSAETLSVQQARALARRIQRRGPQAIRALFDCLFDDSDPSRHRFALLLLTEMKDPYVEQRIHELLQRPHLPDKVRVALLAVEALSDESLHTSPAVSSLAEISLDSLLQFTDSFWESMEIEEITMMWRENFCEEPSEDRLALLEALMKTGNPKMLGIAYLELILGDVKILQFLSRRLADYNEPMAARILRHMLNQRDLNVRTNADRSLARIRERLAAAPPAAAELLPRNRFYRAHAATDVWSGHYSLVYAVKAPNGLIKFVVVLLDRWDRGIIDCWGSVRYTIAEFTQLAARMSRDFADLRQRRIAKRTALTLLNRAMDLNDSRKHPVPLELPVWMHLFINESFVDDPRVPPFGANCSVCRRPVRTSPRLAPPWAFGDVVVCHACSKRTLRCRECGGHTTLTDCLLMHEEKADDIHTLELRCPHCFESFRMPR